MKCVIAVSAIADMEMRYVLRNSASSRASRVGIEMVIRDIDKSGFMLRVLKRIPDVVRLPLIRP